MRTERLELSQCCHHRYLKPARLPIPPRPRDQKSLSPGPERHALDLLELVYYAGLQALVQLLFRASQKSSLTSLMSENPCNNRDLGTVR
jgi:hypothetical protein